jgi:phenylalanyl-tRNA synthetase beta chain
MKAPLEWIKEFVKLEAAPEVLADKLTMAGVEVSSIEYHGRNIKDVVTGKILSAEMHPKKADILICMVDTGEEKLQIITKAANIKAGDVVPVAKHGATLPSGIKIEKRELHGVESFGMLCSTVELGISENAEGIMILPPDTALGEDIKKVLGIGGAVLEVDVLPNRIDLLSVYGVARELAAVLHKPIKQLKYKVKETSSSTSKEAKVEVKDKDLCPRYMARVIKGIKIGPSPKWLEGAWPAAPRIRPGSFKRKVHHGKEVP